MHRIQLMTALSGLLVTPLTFGQGILSLDGDQRVSSFSPVDGSLLELNYIDLQAPGVPSVVFQGRLARLMSNGEVYIPNGTNTLFGQTDMLRFSADGNTFLGATPIPAIDPTNPVFFLANAQGIDEFGGEMLLGGSAWGDGAYTARFDLDLGNHIERRFWGSAITEGVLGDIERASFGNNQEDGVLYLQAGSFSSSGRLVFSASQSPQNPQIVYDCLFSGVCTNLTSVSVGLGTRNFFVSDSSQVLELSRFTGALLATIPIAVTEAVELTDGNLLITQGGSVKVYDRSTGVFTTVAAGSNYRRLTRPDRNGPCMQADDSLEDNDSCATARPIGNGTYPNLFVSLDDKDHYSFCVAAGATVQCDILFTDAIADVDFFLRTANSSECGMGNGSDELADGFSATDNESLTWTNTSGTNVNVVLEVNAFDSIAGFQNCNAYDLIISGSGCMGELAFCDPNGVNCSGTSTTLTSNFGSGVGSGLHLSASNGPSSEFGYFLVSAGMDPVGVSLSRGQFCLLDGVNAFGRYNVSGGASNSIGLFSVDGSTFNNLVGTGTSAGDSGFDVPTSVPIAGSPMIMSGQTWNFQLWHRDAACDVSGSSNFSNGLSVIF